MMAEVGTRLKAGNTVGAGIFEVVAQHTARWDWEEATPRGMRKLDGRMGAGGDEHQAVKAARLERRGGSRRTGSEVKDEMSFIWRGEAIYEGSRTGGRD